MSNKIQWPSKWDYDIAVCKYKPPMKWFDLPIGEYYIKDKITLLELVTYFNYNSSLLVLEYNNSICNKKNWNSIYIRNNDKIEIVTIVGGG